jgi:hypothetical protein
MNNDLRPHRPPHIGANRYAALVVPTAPKPADREIFTIQINAKTKGESAMNEHELLVDLVFKPKVPGLKLRPAETQLLLAYIGEILKEIEEEEKEIKEENANKESQGK